MQRTFTDQLGRRVKVNFPLKRIISVVPSQTELLADLGLENELVGITLFCIHPKSIHATKTRVGGTKTLKFDKIKALEPDLIIANKEENTRSEIEELMQYYPVWISDVRTLDQSFEMMKRVGAITGKEKEAERLVAEIRMRFENFQSETLNLKLKTKKVAYLIWRNPYMVAGGDAFIDDILQRCNFENVFSEKGRYPEVTEQHFIDADPEIVLLSSEPYPFKEKHIAELQAILPDAKIKLVDGELFSWYGSRLLQTPAYLQEVLSEL